MAISESCTISGTPFASISSFHKKVSKLGRTPPSICMRDQSCKMNSFATKRTARIRFGIFAVSGDSSITPRVDVRFPSDYFELLQQEIEFPTAGLESVPGDGEGGIEMTESMLLIRGFCDRFIAPEKATRTRIFFPEANEVDFARQSVFGGSSVKLDYLTKPSLFEDFGFVTKIRMADRVKPEDEIFLVAYPYFNVNEMLVVEELYKEAVVDTDRKLIIFNGELDRIRSGYYPPFFYPKLGALSKSFLPKIETVYYVHNFKGRNGGTLFRSYPGPWQVLRKVRGNYICVHQQEEMPSLKEVALDILPSV
ncbi:protein LPA3 isoform X2 [Typha angustifolia]|uniref:protein LPA3 isoform X2 n=1 Tax=Typha angustifolia TaxID=59011 RepID=UPI003C2CAC3D